MCLHSPTRCWRLAARGGRNGKSTHQEDPSEEDSEAMEDAASAL